MAELSPDEKLQKRNDMILQQLANDTSYDKSFGLTLEEVIALMKKIY